MITKFFPDYFLAQVLYIQLFWNHQLHSRLSVISETGNILDCYVMFLNTLLPVWHKAAI